MTKENQYKKELIKAVNHLTFTDYLRPEDKKKDYELLMTFIDNRL